jgi:uncharacterized membrane protein YfcA
MWEHYRSTFKGIQALIVVAVAGVYLFFGQHWELAAMFLLVMEVGAVVGAAWGARLKARMAARADRLPLRPVS